MNWQHGWILICLYNIYEADFLYAKKPGCGKTMVRSKLNKPFVKSKHIHLATSLDDLMRGIRSIDECNDINDKNPLIVQTAFTAIRNKIERNSSKSQIGVKREIGTSILNKIKPDVSETKPSAKSKTLTIKNADTAIIHKPIDKYLNIEQYSHSGVNTATKVEGIMKKAKLFTKPTEMMMNPHPEGDNTLIKKNKEIDFKKLANLLRANDKHLSSSSDKSKLLDSTNSKSLLNNLVALGGGDASMESLLKNKKNNLTSSDSLTASLNKLDEKKLIELNKSVLKKPNLKALRNSPLWSLSKLIDDVSAITESNRRLNNQTKKTEHVSLIPEKDNKETGGSVKGTVLGLKAGTLLGDTKDTSSLLDTKEGKGTLAEMKEGKASLLVAKDEKAETPNDKVELPNEKETKMLEVKEGLKATLSKAIDRVEKIVANKDGQKKDSNGTKNALIDEYKKNITETEQKLLNETVGGNSTSKEPPKEIVKAPPADPYAEIAEGPDRPKLPELKTDDSSNADSPIMKMNGGGGGMGGLGGGGMSTKPDTSSEKSAPLGGQHDVGGILDSLTDKLNAAGGGVATDQPAVSGNEVKYLQQQLGMQDQDDSSSISEKQAAAEQNEQWKNLDKLKEEADMNDAHKIGDDSPKLDTPGLSTAGLSTNGLQSNGLPTNGLPTSALSPGALASEGGLSPTEGALDKEALEKIASTDEGIGKSLNDKANTLSKFGTMDLMKATKGANAQLPDYADADISAGPDPYANQERMQPQIPLSNSEYQTPHGSISEGETNDYLNTEANPVTSMQNMQNNLEDPNTPPEYGRGVQGQGGYEMADDNQPQGLPGYEDKGEMPGNTRSKTKDEDSYMAAMGDMGVDAYSARHSIPESLWGSNQQQPSQDSTYSNSYNTQLFKKNLILRPKRDSYVSPFSGRESFENEK